MHLTAGRNLPNRMRRGTPDDRFREPGPSREKRESNFMKAKAMKRRGLLSWLLQYFRGLPRVVRTLFIAVSVLVICVTITGVVYLSISLHYIYFDRTDLPEIEQFAKGEFSTIGHVYDLNSQPLAEMSREHRRITQYEEIPAIVRDAILADEDKNFFSHNGVDYSTIPRVVAKIRVGTVLNRMTRVGRQDKADSLVMCRQGGSTI